MKTGSIGERVAEKAVDYLSHKSDLFSHTQTPFVRVEHEKNLASLIDLEVSPLIEALRKWIEDSDYCGHRCYCRAVKGPDNEHWFEHDDCDCGRNQLLAQAAPVPEVDPEAKDFMNTQSRETKHAQGQATL